MYDLLGCQTELHQHISGYRENSIPMIISRLNYKWKSPWFKSNRINITCHNNLKTTNESLKLALLNIRSLSKQSLLINDFITNHNLHALFLSKTWLSANKETSSMLEATPRNYNFLTENRKQRRVGELGRIEKQKTINFKKIFLGTFHSF